jgi:cytoskeletal protein RodZ
MAWQGDQVNNLSPAQEEQLKEIGAHLRELRQEQSMSTEEVAAKTFIPLRLLKALEDGQLDQLPEPVFIQGFIRRYADTLNLDGMALAQTFPISVLPVTTDNSSQGISSQEVSHEPWSVQQSFVLYILILLVVTIASAVLYLLNRPNTANHQLQTKNISQQQNTPAAPKSSSSTAPQAFQSGLPIEVSMSLNDQSWLEVIVDGKTQFEGTLPKGTQKSWTAKQQLTIKVGNAGAVLISSNKQREPKLLGGIGEVRQVTFTPDK